MNPQIKNTWIAALRSGEYQQGTDVLVGRVPEGGLRYCCLGVLCDLAVKAGVEDIRFVNDERGPRFETYVMVDFNESETEYPEEMVARDWREPEDETLPAVVRWWAGLDAANPMLGGGQIGATALNDGDEGANIPRTPFPEIADFIEQDL